MLFLYYSIAVLYFIINHNYPEIKTIVNGNQFVYLLPRYLPNFPSETLHQIQNFASLVYAWPRCHVYVGPVYGQSNC